MRVVSQFGSLLFCLILGIANAAVPDPLFPGWRAGTTLPATCTAGALYFKTDATAGQNIYECTSTNTWTQQLNNGLGMGGILRADAGGTCDAITASFTPPFTVPTLTDKTIVVVISACENVTPSATTFAPDGLAAQPIRSRGGASVNAGDIGPAGFPMILEYHAAALTHWELLNPVIANKSVTEYLTNSTFAADFFIPFASSSTSGYQGLNVTPGVKLNPNTNTVTATTFSGALSGNATTATDANNAINSYINDDTTSNITAYPLWVTATGGGAHPLWTSSTKFTVNPSTGNFGANIVTAGDSVTTTSTQNLFLTSTRVPFTNASNHLVDSAGLTYDTSNQILTVGAASSNPEFILNGGLTGNPALLLQNNSVTKGTIQYIAAGPYITTIVDGVATHLSSAGFTPSAAASIDSGSATLPWKNLYIAGSSLTPGTNNFQITGTATAARTVTLPDASITVARIDAAQTFTGVQTFTSTIAGSINGNAATATTATTTTNIAGGLVNQVPYQTGAGATTFSSAFTFTPAGGVLAATDFNGTIGATSAKAANFTTIGASNAYTQTGTNANTFTGTTTVSKAHDDTFFRILATGINAGSQYADLDLSNSDGPTVIARIRALTQASPSYAGSLQFFTGPGSASGTAPTVKMTIKGDGTVGIGTASPAATLDVNGTLNVSGISTLLTGSTLSSTPSPGDNTTKIATTAFVASAVAGISFKTAVKYATAAALPANTYANGTLGVGATLTANAVGILTVDGNNTVLNDEILVKNETTTANNGIYKVTTAGTAGVAYVLTRRTDADQSAEYTTGFQMLVTAGTANSNTTWAYNGVNSPTMGTTALTFVQSAGVNTYTAGSNISIVGNQIAVAATLPVSIGGSGATTFTAGGLLYGNTTSPLGVSAAGTTGQAAISGGSGSPSWFVPTAGSVLIAGTSGILDQDNSKLFYDKAGTKLGIGTSTPSKTVDISIGYGDVALRLSANNIGASNETNSMDFYDTVSSNQQAKIQTITGSSFGADLQFFTKNPSGSAGSATEKARITGGGNIGIGTTSPSALIHGISTTEQLRLGYDASNYVSNTVSSNGDMSVVPTGYGINFGAIASNVLTAGTFNPGTRYIIDSIGTTNFTLIGAASNTVGLAFTATGVGSGTGTAHSLARFESATGLTVIDGASWDVSRNRFGSNLNAANSNEFAMKIEANTTTNTGSTVGYEKAGLIVWAKTVDPQASAGAGSIRDMVGTQTTVIAGNDGVTTHDYGNIFGLSVDARMERANDGAVFAAEIGVQNSGTDQALVGKVTSKYGIHMVAAMSPNDGTGAANGKGNGTVAIAVGSGNESAGSRWHYGLWSASKSLVNQADYAAWVTSHAYTVGQLVTNGGAYYQCIVAHTSGTFATDLAGGKWQVTNDAFIEYVNSNSPFNDLFKVDVLGNVTGASFIGPLTGNASTATALAADPADCGANTFANAINASGTLSCTSIPNAATTATNANTASAIVARDVNGDFIARIMDAGVLSRAGTGGTAGAQAMRMYWDGTYVQFWVDTSCRFKATSAGIVAC